MSAESTRLYGASDDLIEVEGSLSEEFSPANDEAATYVGFSDGTLASIVYNDDGIWAIRVIRHGLLTASVRPAKGEDEDRFDDGCSGYSDQLTLDGAVTWVVLGTDMVKSSAKAAS